MTMLQNEPPTNLMMYIANRPPEVSHIATTTPQVILKANVQLQTIGDVTSKRSALGIDNTSLFDLVRVNCMIGKGMSRSKTRAAAACLLEAFMFCFNRGYLRT